MESRGLHRPGVHACCLAGCHKVTEVDPMKTWNLLFKMIMMKMIVKLKKLNILNMLPVLTDLR